jgi:hypothetical protein
MDKRTGTGYTTLDILEQMIVFEIVTAIMAILVLLVIACPERLLPVGKKQTRRVGASYWGVYENAAPDDPAECATIEVHEPARKPSEVVGSQMYAMGRGVSVRR